MEDEVINARLARRYWLINSIDWFIGEVSYHKDMRQYFNNKKIKVWECGQKESKTRLDYEASSG